MKTKLFLLIALVAQIGFGQQRTCGMEEHMNTIMFNPVLKKQYEERQARFQVEYQKIIERELAKRNGNVVDNANVIIRIPVAVHYPSAGSANATLKACLRNFAQNQVDILNADYNATNADIALWNDASVHYPGVNVGDLDIEFVIATQNHPASSGLVNGEMAVTFGTDFLLNADSDLDWNGYMNFVVRNISGGILGYSPLGGSPAAGQTVVMDNNAFASGAGCTGYVPGAPYNLGRTVTHELGHFFNLNHIFKSASSTATNCGGADSDGIADTPKQAAATYGCVADGSIDACIAPEKVLSMNYMDYSNDACMYMFTVGQKNVALAYINTILSEYKDNVLSTASIENSNFSIYPNPNKGIFNIEFKEVVTDFTVKILDVTGKAIYDYEFSGNSDLIKEVNLNNVASRGIYFMTIKTDKDVITKKIVIE
ncbi:zinc-dependent metalloprotease [Flavobacterium urocaniciphilum]|uniref:Por secretion system C-terminal sorting domain-containing protein n=1 Tax=Flavobacterium urocaniciphilum TaxID=1299341 RepID=A0A1H9C876_9FLAO|nr:zinc-dependent metalloprotease [Flavobacterium urocaniciphilum]SEP97167.1 Por secretion system C-terminal sorting domain-containing protein [Flavobacterium urocaniciphilum]